MKPRIVSLVPSSTETLLALGAEVVACTKFCEQPDLPHVGGTKNPDLAEILALSPDLVVLDREENRIEDHEALVAAGCNVFVSDVTDLDRAIAVVAELAEAAEVAPPVLDLPHVAWKERRTAFVPIWRRPWMTISAATYGSSLLHRIGIDTIAGGTGSIGSAAYPAVELSDVAAARPDLVLVPSEPYEFSDQHLDDIADAFPDASVRRVDGQDLFWWGIRTPAALSRLGAALCGLP